MRKKFLVLSMITMVATGVFSGCNTKAVEPVKVEAAEKSVEVGSFKSDSLDFYRELSEEIGAIEIIDSADLSLEDLENRKGKIIIEKCIGVEEKSDGYYILEVTVGCVTIKKALMDADKPMEEISTEPKTDGFYLNIPDTK